MAYAASGLKMIAAGGSAGTAPGNVQNLFAYSTNDTAAVVLAADYFNSATGFLKAGDRIAVFGDLDGSPYTLDLIVLSDDGTTVVVGPSGNSKVITGTTAADLPNSGIVLIATTGAATYSLASPVEGCDVLLVRSGATTEVQTIRTASTGAFINFSTGRAAVMDAQAEMIGLRGISATRYVADRNIGSVTVTT